MGAHVVGVSWALLHQYATGPNTSHVLPHATVTLDTTTRRSSGHGPFRSTEQAVCSLLAFGGATTIGTL